MMCILETIVPAISSAVEAGFKHANMEVGRMGGGNRTSLGALFCLAFALAGASHADTTQKGEDCLRQVTTQAQMNKCASDQLAGADAELNDVYLQLLHKAADEPGAVQKIKVAERACMGCLQGCIDRSDVPAPDKQGEYGSVYPLKMIY